MIQFIVKFLVWMVFVSMTTSEIHQGGGAIELTSRTFDKSVRDGSVWIIELYAPWCIHCRTFAPSYEVRDVMVLLIGGVTMSRDQGSEVSKNFARLLHAENKKGVKQIKVAKVDADSERAIVSRFNIAGFPSFYLIDGWKVYEYNEDLSAASMMSFAKGGYKQQEVSACCGALFLCFLKAFSPLASANHRVRLSGRPFHFTRHPWDLLDRFKVCCWLSRFKY